MEASVKTDAALAYKFVQYIERWMQRYLSYHEGQVPFDFEILDVHIFNKDSVIDRELKLANSGVPNKMRLAASAGMTPDKVTTSQIWENQYLKIYENWLPLQTSYTMSTSNTGRPTNAEGDVSDSTTVNNDSGESEEV